MTCPECYGDSFKSGQYEIAQVMDGRPRLFVNVRARQCVQCGYLVVAAPALREMQRRVGLGAYSDMLPVEVYDLSIPVGRTRNRVTETPRLRTLYTTSAHPELEYEPAAIA